MIDSKEECRCPHCGGRLIKKDKVLRGQKIVSGERDWYVIHRFKCVECSAIHRQLPDFMVPYKQYAGETIEDVIEGVISEEDPVEHPCDMTMKHWRWWAKFNEPQMEGQMRSAAYRFLDFSDQFLKSREALLEELKRRISPGWLMAVCRFIYNSGGRLSPVAECT